RPGALGGRNRRKGEGLGQGLDRTDKPPGEISAAGQPAWFRDRTWTDRDLGQIDGLFGRCLWLQVRVDDQFEQAYPVLLERPVTVRGRRGVPQGRLRGYQSRLEQLVVPAVRASGKDLDDTGGEADQHTDLPGAVVRTGKVKDQPPAPGAQRRS